MTPINHPPRTLVSNIFEGYVKREDVYRVDDTRDNVHYFVTIDDSYKYANGRNGVRASHICALLNWLQQRYFDYMPFRARQLGTQVVMDSPYMYEMLISNLDKSVKTASNGYKLILNPARLPSRDANYAVCFNTTNAHHTREKWSLDLNVSVSRKNIVLIDHVSLKCRDDKNLPIINVWVGTEKDKMEWLKTLESIAG